MINVKEEWLVAFHSTHHAIAAERLGKEAGWSMEMIPTPRDISASCGLSLHFPVSTETDQATVMQKLKEKRILWAGVYLPEKAPKNGKKWKLLVAGEE